MPLLNVLGYIIDRKVGCGSLNCKFLDDGDDDDNDDDNNNDNGNNGNDNSSGHNRHISRDNLSLHGVSCLLFFISFCESF